MDLSHGKQPESPIDMTELLEIMDHDNELLTECMNDFVNDYPEMLNQIRSAIDTGNGEDLEASAHAMKGSLKYIAAFKASDFALELENMGKSGGKGDARKAFAHLEKECDLIRLFIQDHLH